MNKHLRICIAVSTCLFSSVALSAPGEYWEVTSKMEMPGMPFAMPATTTKVCIAKGGEKDPGKTSGDKDCQATDVKTVGNKTTWNMRCDHNGDVMTGSGEQTTNANGYDGKIQFASKSQKRDRSMSMVFSGKRIGGSCDSEEANKKAQAQVQEYEKAYKADQAKMCDTSGYNAYKWASSATLFIGQTPPCPGKTEALCQVLRNDVPRDIQAFEALAQQERPGMPSATKACNVSLDGLKKSLCKNKAHSGPQSFLDANCPAEAKIFREEQRRKNCEGRSYTAETRAEDMKRCLSGKDEEDEGSDDSGEDEAPAPNKSGKSSANNPAADVLEGAKKLKGMFGF